MSFVCVYILKKKKKKQKKNKKKNSRFPKFSQKKRKIFKKKNLWTRDIGLPSDFFKKGPFFFFLSKISRFFKIFFSKWYMRIPWTKLCLNCGV